jgi:uncharacterized protein YbjT (DUF2867 family)
MNVLLFGATGMVGQGVLRECLIDSEVELVQMVGRRVSGSAQPKVREIAHADLWSYADIEPALAGFDACFFCLGMSSAGMKEDAYDHVTRGITLAAAETLVRLNPGMTFVYVSGTGTDSSEQGNTMWARVKGRTENELLRLPFKAAYMFRPGFIQPMHGESSKTPLYRVLYQVLRPLVPLLMRAFPNAVLTTEDIGRAMLICAKRGAPKAVLEIGDIRALVS